MSISLYFITILYTLFIVPKSSYAFEAYSSCQKSTNWTRNYGDELRSWINSIVPSASQFKINLQVMFLRNKLTDKPTKIYSNKIRWDKVGPNKMDGWIYGQTDDEGQFRDGHTYFIFPDFKTAIIGTFEGNKLVSGVETKATHFRCINGMIKLKFSKVKPNSPIYRHTERNMKVFSDNHQLRDPLERKNVYIGSSTVIPEIAHQDALFARRDIPPFTLVSYYGGSYTNLLFLNYFSNLTIDESEDSQKNVMGFNETHAIDVPPSMSSIIKYRSTLGHKANHLFKGINTMYTATIHPVYGRIKCLESTRYIKRGEEIIVNYHYNMNGLHVPRWYRELHDKTFPNSSQRFVSK